MGNLRLDEVFVWYDGPRLFTCSSEAGQQYLAVFADEDDESEVYLYAPVSPFRIRAVRSGQLPLRAAFERPEDGHLYVVRQSLTTADLSWDRLRAEQIDPEWFPAQDARVERPTETQPHFEPGALAQQARSGGRSLAALELDSDRTRTEFPLRSLGAVMQLLQETVDAFGQVVRDKKTNRGAIQPDILEQSSIDFIGVRAASFVLVVAPTVAGQLFESSLVAESLSRLMEVVAAGESEDSLLPALEGLHTRALSKYRGFLEELFDVESGVRIFIATPVEDLRSVSLSRSGVELSLRTVRDVLPGETKRLEVYGVLIAVNTRTHTFELRDDESDRRYSGKAIETARFQLLGLTTNNTYHAVLIEEHEIQPVTGEVQYKYRLIEISARELTSRGRLPHPLG